VEVKDPPQGIVPPSQQDPRKRRGHDAAAAHRLRKFVAKPSAGLRVRVHPTLQSEQIAVLRVDGVVAIADELQNSDGTWVRLAPEAMISMGIAQHAEGWCLQYNSHLEKTLLVPVNDEPVKSTGGASRETAYMNGTAGQDGEATDVFEAPAASVFQPEQPLLRRSRADYARRSSFRGPGLFTVIKCGASGHNIRSNPSLSAAPIGKLNHGDVVAVTDVKEDGGEVWVLLDPYYSEKHCFNFDANQSRSALSFFCSTACILRRYRYPLCLSFIQE
jgi:E3 ubiquitin-protein ligase MYCBP2